MTGTILRRTVPLARTAVLLLGMTAGLAGCGALDVSDPTAVEESELSDAAGAELLRGAALRALFNAADDAAYLSGLLADEFLFDPPSWAAPGSFHDELLDRRESAQYEAMGADGGYPLWQELRRAATVAMPKLRAYAPADAAQAKVGEMFALRGFAALSLAENFCPGFPLNDVVDLRPVFNPPLTTEEALAKALADFDSAVAYAADSTRILHFAKIGRARTLLALGRLDEAGVAVDGVPAEYVAKAEYLESAGLANHGLAFGLFGDLSRGVANQEGGNGLDFVTASDPRVQLDTLGTANDGVTGIYRVANYPTPDAPIILASGTEARLIEAEAALQGGGDWLGILNALRTTCTDAATCPDPAPAGDGGVAGLPPLTDPGTESARIDLLFRERAMWLFATGHRLGDLRRLIRVYDRPAETVFPTGAYRLGGTYATATSIPFPAARESTLNPAVTGCISR